MKLFSLATLLVATTTAISLKDVEQVPTEFVQTTADTEVDTEVEAEVDAEEYGIHPGYPKNDHCDCDDHDYYCPPVLEKCPGVLQLPAPCTTALKAAPLCYCNNGWMHTDWDHNVSVDGYKACDNCGKKPHKKPHKKPEPSYPPKNEGGYPPEPSYPPHNNVYPPPPHPWKSDKLSYGVGAVNDLGDIVDVADIVEVNEP